MIFAILLLAVPLLSLPAESYEWVTFDLREIGLHSEQVTAIAEGPNSMLWVGTNSGEVVSFNGQKWETHPNDDLEGLVRTYINSIAPDRDGAIWAIEGERLWRYANGKWSTYTGSVTTGIAKPAVWLTGQECWDSSVERVRPEVTDEGVPFIWDIPTHVAVDMEGTLWIASRGFEKVIFRFDREQRVSCWDNDLFPAGSYQTFQLAILPRGEVFLVLAGGHFFIFSDSIWSKLPSPPTPISTFSGDVDGRLWGGAKDGIYQLYTGTWDRVISWKDSIAHTRAVQADNKGGVWAIVQTTDNKGKLFHITSNNELREFVYPHDVPLNPLGWLSPISMLLDDQERVWIGDEKGIHLLDSIDLLGSPDTVIPMKTWGSVKEGTR